MGPSWVRTAWWRAGATVTDWDYIPPVTCDNGPEGAHAVAPGTSRPALLIRGFGVRVPGGAPHPSRSEWVSAFRSLVVGGAGSQRGSQTDSNTDSNATLPRGRAARSGAAVAPRQRIRSALGENCGEAVVSPGRRSL